ncbi:MAG: glycyl-radical enzyme activating protein, partial [Bacteroidota bacterium]
SWCCNPESQSDRPQLRYIGFRCRQCLECIDSCPYDAVTAAGGIIHRRFELCSGCREKGCIDKCNHDALSLSGREITPGELTRIIALDIPFYRNSGGGVTFSGGEPLMQPAFLYSVLSQCKELGIHTAVETCGWGSRDALQKILPVTDLFLYDLKITDPHLHLQHTGKPVEPILSNLAFLATQTPGIVIRLPLVPGITDTATNIEAICTVMSESGLKRISIEPYHTLGVEKYAEHGMEYGLDDFTPYDRDQLGFIQASFLSRGFSCEIA